MEDRPSKILLVSLSSCFFFALLFSCNSPKKESEVVSSKPKRYLIGVIKGVQGKDFVVFKRTARWVPKAGEELEWRPRDGSGEGGLLERSLEKRGTLFIADIKSGSPGTGDLIYYQEIPGTPDEKTETVGAVAELAGEDGADLIEEGPPAGETKIGLDASDLPPLRLPPEEIRAREKTEVPAEVAAVPERSSEEENSTPEEANRNPDRSETVPPSASEILPLPLLKPPPGNY